MRTTVKQQRTKRVTLADVAAVAGVSVATASVAITGRPSGNCRVSPAVADKIRRAAATLNYRPNLQARNLSTRRTRTVAILIKRPAWHNAMFYIAVVQRILRQHGYTEMVMLQPESTLASEREHLELCIERQVEGIVAVPLIDMAGQSNVETFNRVYQDEGIPIVQVQLALEGCVAPSVVFDEVGGFRQAVTLLHAMGHRNIAHLTMKGYDNTDPFNPFCVAHQRYLGYRDAMEELELTEQVFSPTENASDLTRLYDAGLALAPRIAAADPRPTAVITFSDYGGAGLMRGLDEINIKVPDDISIIGVGDQLFGRMLKPKMTVLAPPFEEVAEQSTRMLLAMIEGGQALSVRVMPKMYPRESVRQIQPV
jgi:LacI family transcriptional regulator